MRPLLALFLCSWAFAGEPLPDRSWLVLPLENGSADGNLEWISDSVAEVIAEPLRARGLSVVPRDGVDEISRLLNVQPRSRLTKASVMLMGRRAGARHIVYGQFGLAEDSAPAPHGTIRARIRIIDLASLLPGPEFADSDDMANLAELQSRLAWRVYQYAAGDEAPDQEEFFDQHPPVRIDAMENYVRGLLAEDLEDKHHLFTRAVNLAPEFDAPYFELGRMQWGESSYRVAAGWLERVGEHSSRYPEARFLLGLCYYWMGKYPQSQQNFELLVDRGANAALYNNLALVHYRLGAAEAIEYLVWASDRHPDDPDLLFNTGYLLWRQGDFETAAGQLEKALAIDPSDEQARMLLERCRAQSGPRRGDIRSEGLERLKEDYPSSSWVSDPGRMQTIDH